jgi:hypothetical protein
VSATIKSLRPNQRKHCTTDPTHWESLMSQTFGSAVLHSLWRSGQPFRWADPIAVT